MNSTVTGALAIAVAITLFVRHPMPQEPLPEPSDPPAIVAIAPEQAAEALVEDAMPDDVICEETADVFREDVPLQRWEQESLWAACEEFGVEYEVMLSLIETETRFQNIYGDGGASAGYCQIQKRWWGDLMDEIGAYDLLDPEDNFRTACAIMAQHLERYGDDMAIALTVYNMGHYNGKITNYAYTVLNGAEKWRI